MDNINDNIDSKQKNRNKAVTIIIAILIPAAACAGWTFLQIAVQLVMSIASTAYINPVNHPELTPEQIEQALNSVFYRYISVMYIGAAVIFIVLFVLIYTKTGIKKAVNFSFVRAGYGTYAISFITGTFVGAFFNLLLSVLVKYLPQSWVEANEESVGAFDGGGLILSLIATVVFAPVVEEIIFRGLLYSAVKKIVITIPKQVTHRVHIASVIISAAVASAVFGIYHGNILQAIYAGILSLFMIWFYELSGSLISNILFHAAFNFSGVVAGLLALTGTYTGIAISAVSSVILMVVSYKICRNEARINV